MPVQETDIVWTDASANHWVGCAKTSEGCRNCWAADMAGRFNRTPEPWTVEHVEENLQVYDENFAEELGTLHPGWVFTPSSSDPCLPWLPDSARSDWVNGLRRNPQHCYQVLTKWGAEDGGLPIPELPDNAMLGVSCESPRRLYRLDWLRDQDATIKFVSFEPLVERIPADDVDLSGIDWIIVGGESQRDADRRREMDPEWAHELREAAREDECAFLFKQHSGAYAEEDRWLSTEFEQQKFTEFPETPAGVPDTPREFLSTNN